MHYEVPLIDITKDIKSKNEVQLHRWGSGEHICEAENISETKIDHGDLSSLFTTIIQIGFDVIAAFAFLSDKHKRLIE